MVGYRVQHSHSVAETVAQRSDFGRHKGSRTVGVLGSHAVEGEGVC